MKRRFRMIAAVTALCLVLGCAAPLVQAETPGQLHFLIRQSRTNGECVIDTFVDAATGAPVPRSGETAASAPKKAPARASASLPAAYDARNAGVITGIRNQGQTSCCWAFAALGALESDAITAGYDDLTANYSEAHLGWFAQRSLSSEASDPTRGDGTLNPMPYTTGGNWAIAATALARWSGIAEEASFPYSPQIIAFMGDYPESQRYVTDSGIVMRSAEELTSPGAIKQWILDHGAVTATMFINSSAYEYRGAYYCNVAQDPNHAILLIGWDDSYSATNFKSSCRPATDGAWLVKDSWGTGNHQNGYFWISYADAVLGTFVGFTAQPEPQFAHNYTYNGNGWNVNVDHDGNCKAANVFTTVGRETLSAAAFYTLVPNQEVTISVYRLLATTVGPVRGSPLLTQTVTLANEGYHTVDLDSPQTFDAGTRFSVVVEYKAQYDSSAGAMVAHIPMEYNCAAASYAAQSGQSYLWLPAYLSTPAWYEPSAFDPNLCNTLVQALTTCSHSMTEREAAATCETDGYHEIVCSVCGKTIRTVYPAPGHRFGDWSPAVYAGDGQRERHRACATCGYVETQVTSTGARVVPLNVLIRELLAAFEDALQRLFRGG